MRSDADPENAHERLRKEVAEIIAAFSDGELTVGYPFDLATSSALAANIDQGTTAELLFDTTASRTPSYRVSVEQISGPFTRSVLDTTVASEALLITLLDSLLNEFELREPPS